MKKDYSKYVKYISSDEWYQVRLRVYKDRGHKCERCSSTIKLEVHHKTYKNLFNEPLRDLLLLCQKCHKAEHKKLKTTKVTKRSKSRKNTKKKAFCRQMYGYLPGLHIASPKSKKKITAWIKNKVFDEGRVTYDDLRDDMMKHWDMLR